jgi:uncharacterized protein YecT (DUF1311 family)
MTRFCWLVVALLLSCAFPAGAVGLPVAHKTIVIKNSDINVSIQYPQTGNKAVDTALKAYVEHAVDAFKYSAEDKQPNERAYTLETTYTVARNDDQIFAVVFTEFYDLNGAHPNTNYATFNFLLPDGAQIFLPEILDGSRGIARVSDLATAKLLHNIGTGPNAVDRDTILGGAGPSADNFKNFVWLPDRLHLYFPPYQVAPYVYGPQDVFIPLAALRDVVRSDWRAPAPSFDCRSASRGIERAICADAELARLDREVADAYQTKLRNALQPAEKATLRQSQRAWIALRNTSCVAAATTACVAKLYRERLATLERR